MIENEQYIMIPIIYYILLVMVIMKVGQEQHAPF